jgi:hypothetical protein
MVTITIQEDFDGGPSIPTQHLRPGEVQNFGRGGPGSPVDISLAPEDRAISRLAGVITARDTFWCITNESWNKTYVVEHTDQVPGYIQVQPGMREAVIPFETSRVRIPGAEREYTFLVMAPEQGPVPDRAGSSGDRVTVGCETEAAYRLDRWNTYFRVLVAFCEPQLQGPTSEIPTQIQVANRLGLSRPAVNAHIEYLLNRKLKIGNHGHGAGVDWRQRALVEHALRFGLVTEADLQLLPEIGRS